MPRVYLLTGEKVCQALEMEGIPEARIHLLAGSGQLRQHYFSSEAEASAFLLGVSESKGWGEALAVSKEQWDALLGHLPTTRPPKTLPRTGSRGSRKR